MRRLRALAESPVVDELHALVICGCRFVLKPALSCVFASQQFSSLHAVSGAHVPWMCLVSTVKRLLRCR